MAIMAGGFGSFPAPESRYIDSSSFSNSTSNSSCRRVRRKPNSLRVRSSRFMSNCSCRLSSCRGFQWRIAIASPRKPSLPPAEDHALRCRVDPPILSDRSAGAFKPIGALGQLGNGDTLSRQQPTEVRNVSAPVAIAAGDTHTCAATSAAVLCWGQNADGQLGNGAAGPASSTPTQISQSLTANPLGLGADHSCAVASGSDLWCWGKNDSGQVGVSGDDQQSPQRVMSNVAAVVAGF